MVPVLLLGDLGKRYGRKFTLDVKTPAEAIRALVANFPDIQKHMADRYYRVVVGREDAGTDELHNPAGRQVIKIVPVVTGAGGGMGKILLGAIIIGAAFFTGGASLAASGFLIGGITTTFWGGIALSIGASLMLGGAAQMLAPTQAAGKPSEDSGKNPSYAFNGPVNTTAQGQPIAVGYGRLRVGSAVISAGITTEDIAI